ncbi:lipase family protein [Pseudactinotalea suaedae]|uniref:lipase family protein n=1 Tax=Pseudactinotalea suaedae TaxID=1524924 RepID=UPI0012E1F253|nr:lipase family protein [Pseudactinotalea suaedae]
MRSHARLLSRLPRPWRVAIGAVAVVAGIVVLTRPTTSLGLLALLIGAAMLVAGALEAIRSDEGETRRSRLARWGVAGLWWLGGVFVLAYPALTVRTTALVAGGALVASGIRGVVTGSRSGQATDARVAEIAFGLAGVVLGVLALLWPDITLLVVAVTFGARLAGAGALLLWHTLRPPPTPATEPERPGPLRRWSRTVAAVVVLLLAIGAAGLSYVLRQPSAVVDEFYAAPRTVPDESGTLIRSEPFTREVPEGASAWRILYTTTHGDGSPAIASGLVVVPDGPSETPVIAWTHGTTGFARHCAPSLLAEPFESGALLVLPEILEQGWSVVATDYIGLGTDGPHPYLVGPDSARAALDAVRAARQLEEPSLGVQTVAWGHSQGGGAALWVGAIAPEYAPDVPLSGVAALAPASNLPAFVDTLAEMLGGSIFSSFVAAGYTSTYDDVHWDDYVRPGASTFVRSASQRCLTDPGTAVTVLNELAGSRDPRIYSADPTTGPFGQRLQENVPPATIGAPLLLAQGEADMIISAAAQQTYVDGLCAASQQVDHRSFPGLGHVDLVEPGSPLVPELLSWTHERLDGARVTDSCERD